MKKANFLCNCHRCISSICR